jgi:hypothetical protein
MADVNLEIIDLSTGQSVGTTSLTICQTQTYELDIGNYHLKATYLVTGEIQESDISIVEGVNPPLEFTFATSPPPVVDPRVMLGVSLYGNYLPADVTTAINTWVASVGKGICWWNIVHIFGPSSAPEAFWELDAFASMVASGLVKGIIFSWQPCVVYTSPLDPSGACTQDIANGVYDVYITTVANQCKTVGFPIIIRLGHEMNGAWMGWGTNPTVYKAMWARVVNIFKSVGASNVKFHWCPGYFSNTGYTFRDYYPGDGYVDYVGIDCYGTTDVFYKYPVNQILDPAGNVYNTYPHKPYLIGEWGLNNDGEMGDAANLAWLNAFFNVIESNPRIIGMSHWHYSWYAVDTEPLTYAEYIHRISLGLYTSNLVQWTSIPPQSILNVHSFLEDTEIIAQVQIKGIGTYDTPFTLELNPGQYTLSSSYQTQQQTKVATLTSGQTTNIVFNFSPTPQAAPLIAPVIVVISLIGLGTAYALLKKRKGGR